MRPVRALVIYVAVVFVGGGLLAPWLYWLAQSFSHVFPTLAANPFHRFVNRALLGLALIGLWPLLRSLDVRSANDIGLVRPAGQWLRLAGGFALGFGSLAAVAVIVFAMGARQMRAEVEIASKLLGIAATAVVVAVLEEILFRGGLFGALRKSWHWRFALVLSSMVYALVHFLARAKLEGPVDWLSGLALLPQMLRGFTNWSEVIPGFFNLTLAGMLLGMGYHRTGNLYFPIGLHAGWIFWLKGCGVLTAEVPGSAVRYWGTAKLIDGWLASVVLGLLLTALCRQFRNTKQHSRYEGICY